MGLLFFIFFISPLSSKLSNSSLMRRSCRPYFWAAHRAGGADLERPRKGYPSVGVPKSSSALASSNACDSELRRILLLPVVPGSRSSGRVSCCLRWTCSLVCSGPTSSDGSDSLSEMVKLAAIVLPQKMLACPSPQCPGAQV